MTHSILTMPQEWLIIILNTVILMIGTYQDIQRCKINNKLNLIGFSSILLLMFVFRIQIHWTSLLLTFVICVFLQAIGGIGGGDGKLLMILSLSLPVESILVLFWWSLLCFLIVHIVSCIKLFKSLSIKTIKIIQTCFIKAASLEFFTNMNSKQLTKKRFTYCIFLSYINLIINLHFKILLIN